MSHNFEKIRDINIGTVEFVSTKEIKVLLDIDAPFSTSLNTGVPQQFPRINGFLLIPNEAGALLGVITWIGIEYSSYPKRKGYKDFDLVDLPFPLRKLSLSPLGILKQTENGYEIERGVYSYPSVGDVVIIPTQEQLKAIVQNKDLNAKVKIGISPMAANAPIFIDPDKIFGRHLAILGNTGSGKSCSVAGLVRWSLETAKSEIKNGKNINARFIILDPNGEYGNCFEGLGNIKKFEVKLRDEEDIKQLKVPSWMWDSWEWASISQASARTQRPILRRALREIKNAEITKDDDINIIFKNLLVSLKISLLNFQRKPADLSAFPGKQNYGESLEGIKKSLETFNNKLNDQNYRKIYNDLNSKLDEIKTKHSKNNKGYFPSFSLQEVDPLLEILNNAETQIGQLIPYEGPDEDSPVFFKNADFLTHIERLAQEANQQQYLDFFLMRVRSLFTDKRIASVIRTENAEEITLQEWLNQYIGDNQNNPSITIIDLSLLPSEILYLVVSVMARLIFEAHHRYKKLEGQTLPTILVVDEAHNLIKRYETDNEDISAQRLCSQIFEKIAKEGRKFGVGLVIASQRPSELSQTVLSQCNTFLLHRIVSDRDQEMVKKLVPDTMGGILNELSVLPSRKAILLGWAAPIPVLVEMNELPEVHRPKSKDPDFWKVWINEEERSIDWGKISDDWQQKGSSDKKLENKNGEIKQ
ncbi:MAG TPA: ATP-binding protein [Syntrophorhabdaceae bacterium]|nr:ATP-binding protein [Syntrophorhabdaceae bacterium]